jgi:sugar phosphate isomerase/epimerase
VNLWTVYRWSLSEPVGAGVLKRIGAMGATGVELVLDRNLNSAEALLGRRGNAVRGRIGMVHAKDYDHGLRAHVLCGQGDLSRETILATLRGVGYDDYVTVETPPSGGRSGIPMESGLAAAETSVRWLRRWL